MDSIHFLDRILVFKIDRPLGCAHNSIIYELNYGHIPAEFSADGKELDVYLIGVNTGLRKDMQYIGECITVIHRLNDIGDKLVLRLMPDSKEYTAEEIRRKTDFQEKFFETEIILKS